MNDPTFCVKRDEEGKITDYVLSVPDSWMRTSRDPWAQLIWFLIRILAREVREEGEWEKHTDR